MRRILCLLALLALAALLLVRLPSADRTLPGTLPSQRELVRIWTISAPGGAMSWLRHVLRDWEGKHPGVQTYVRQVDASALAQPDAVLPDLVLYMPGDLASPEGFAPIEGAMEAEEALLRCGRWQGRQMAVPLCWGGYVLAIADGVEDAGVATPAPTALLGAAAPSSALPTATPPYPIRAVRTHADPLQCPQGAALFTLALMLPGECPTFAGDFGSLSAEQVYQRFLAGKCASAVLTTGQAFALGAAPCRVMTADEIITDQVWLASIPEGACASVASLIAALMDTDAQRQLARQGLHSVNGTLRLYASGTPGDVQRAAMHGLTVINAFIPREEVTRAAWRVLGGQQSLSDALLPLL